MPTKNKLAETCKNNVVPYIIWLLISAALVAVDRISKVLIVRYLPDGKEVRVIPYVFNFVYVENRGAAWGILANNRWVFIVISSIAIIGIAFALLYLARYKKPLVSSLSLIFAGGIGNMIDRLANGYVVDFIQFDFFKKFPVFNVADSYVTIGGFMIVIYLIFFDKTLFAKKEKKSDENDNSDAGA